MSSNLPEDEIKVLLIQALQKFNKRPIFLENPSDNDDRMFKLVDQKRDICIIIINKPANLQYLQKIHAADKWFCIYYQGCFCRCDGNPDNDANYNREEVVKELQGAFTILFRR